MKLLFFKCQRDSAEAKKPQPFNLKKTFYQYRWASVEYKMTSWETFQLKFQLIFIRKHFTKLAKKLGSNLSMSSSYI